MHGCDRMGGMHPVKSEAKHPEKPMCLISPALSEEKDSDHVKICNSNGRLV